MSLAMTHRWNFLLGQYEEREKTLSEPIRFLAALAGQSSAAKWLAVASDGSCKLVLEADAQQLASILRLAVAGEKLLHVAVEIE